MLELDISIETFPIDVPSDLKKSFKSRLVFYLLNKNSFYLCTFVIVDFQEGKIAYLESFSEENVEKVKTCYDPAILKDPPHSIMTIDENKLLNIVYPILSKVNNTFRVVDLKERKMKIYSPEDFGYTHLGVASETATRDVENSDWFYMCFVRKDKTATEYYKILTDLTDHKFMFDDRGIFIRQPHQVVRFKNFILSSGFGEEQGQILSYNMKTKEIELIETTTSPSHLEVEGDTVYYASNNMRVDGTKVTFLGPAAIGKLKVVDDIMKRDGEFRNESGFRFTTHKKLNSNTLVTIGFPNRMFFIDSNSMKLLFYYDIDKQIIPDDSQMDFLNSHYEQTLDDPFRYTALEISDDRKYVVFFNQAKVRFFNYSSKKIEHEIPYEIKDTYIQLSHHCNFLR